MVRHDTLYLINAIGNNIKSPHYPLLVACGTIDTPRSIGPNHVIDQGGVGWGSTSALNMDDTVFNHLLKQLN